MINHVEHKGVKDSKKESAEFTQRGVIQTMVRRISLPRNKAFRVSLQNQIKKSMEQGDEGEQFKKTTFTTRKRVS